MSNNYGLPGDCRWVHGKNPCVQELAAPHFSRLHRRTVHPTTACRLPCQRTQHAQRPTAATRHPLVGCTSTLRTAPQTHGRAASHRPPALWRQGPAAQGSSVRLWSWQGGAVPTVQFRQQPSSAPKVARWRPHSTGPSWCLPCGESRRPGARAAACVQAGRATAAVSYGQSCPARRSSWTSQEIQACQRGATPRAHLDE